MTKQEFSDFVKTLPVNEYYYDNVVVNREDYVVPTVLLIEKRCQHCMCNLMAHLDEAQATSQGQIVAWKGGHFSYPVYEQMQEFLEAPSFDKIQGLIAQQALRSLLDCPDFPDYKHMFYFLTEALLVGGNRY